MNKKKRSIFYLILTVLVTALVGVVQITGMPLWTPWEVVPMIGEIELGLDLQGGMRVVYQADFTGLEVEDEAASLQGAMDVLRTRLDTAGYTEATITKQGNDQIVVEVPGVADANELSDVLTPAIWKTTASALPQLIAARTVLIPFPEAISLIVAARLTAPGINCLKDRVFCHAGFKPATAINGFFILSDLLCNGV